MGHERDLLAQLGANLLLMDMTRQTIRDQIILQILDIVLRAGFRACAAVSADAEDGGLAGDVWDEGRDADLGCGGVAAWV